jgi:alpha-mannosidase
MRSELEAIERLLLHEWDPIGLSDCDGAENHCDGYALRVFEMLKEGADAIAIA